MVVDYGSSRYQLENGRTDFTKFDIIVKPMVATSKSAIYIRTTGNNNRAKARICEVTATLAQTTKTL